MRIKINMENIKEYSEETANRYIARCIHTCYLVCLFCWVLNILDVFIIDQKLFANTTITMGVIAFSTRIILLFTGFEKPYVKYLLILSSALAIYSAYIFLTYHIIAVLAIPVLFASIYRDQKMVLLAYGVVCVLIFVSTILGYRFGLVDANMVLMTTTNTKDFIDTFSTMTPMVGLPYLQLSLFYAFPRCAILFSIIPLLKKISLVIDKQTAEKIRQEEKNIELLNNHRNIQQKIILSLSSLIGSRDSITGDHVKNSTEYVKFLVDILSRDHVFDDYLNDVMRDAIINAAPMHDVGKIKIPDSILCKPSKLTDEEFKEMKNHPQYGLDILNEISSDLGESDFLDVAKQMAIYHHEKYDGGGYPYNLRGKDIPICARIMAVGDVIDALLAKRQYKSAMSIDKIKDILISEKGNHFDPEIIDCLERHWNEFVVFNNKLRQN